MYLLEKVALHASLCIHADAWRPMARCPDIPNRRVHELMPFVIASAQVILTAAEMAPSFTEALLHQHIGGADCELGGNDPAAKHAAQLLGTLNLAATASKLTSPDYPARGVLDIC